MEAARRLLLLLLLHHLLPAAPLWQPIQRATTPRLTKAHRRALNPLCCTVPPPPPQPPVPAYLEPPPQPPVPADLEQPPQPANAWLPFGELPGTGAIYRFLATPQFELAVCAVVILSVTVFALETLPMPNLDADMPGLPDMLAAAGRDFEDVTTVAFAIEYFARWWSRSLRPSYLLKPLMLIDLASFLPSLLTLVNLDLLSPGIRTPPMRPEFGQQHPLTLAHLRPRLDSRYRHSRDPWRLAFLSSRAARSPAQPLRPRRAGVRAREGRLRYHGAHHRGRSCDRNQADCERVRAAARSGGDFDLVSPRGHRGLPVYDRVGSGA